MRGGVSGAGRRSKIACAEDPPCFQTGLSPASDLTFGHSVFLQNDDWLKEIERIFPVGKIPGLPSAN